jgi:hypothetical protein
MATIFVCVGRLAKSKNRLVQKAFNRKGRKERPQRSQRKASTIEGAEEELRLRVDHWLLSFTTDDIFFRHEHPTDQETRTHFLFHAAERGQGGAVLRPATIFRTST